MKYKKNHIDILYTRYKDTNKFHIIAYHISLANNMTWSKRSILNSYDMIKEYDFMVIVLHALHFCNAKTHCPKFTYFGHCTSN